LILPDYGRGLLKSGIVQGRPARFQRDWHQPARRDCHRKSRTAISD
jgi:hypothetical protein